MDKDGFDAARERVIVHERTGAGNGIGTLGEKTLHAVVKLYLEPDPAKHERKIGSFVADIFTGERIYEIQTRQFGKLYAKLETFLKQYPVTVVYPIQARKWLYWVDPDDGAISGPRLSPRRGRVYDVFPELYRIKPLLLNPNLSLLILQIDLDEYRILDGWSHNRKKGSHRENRVPRHLDAELLLSGPSAYTLLVPANLPETFSSSDFADAALISKTQARIALNILSYLDAVCLCGKCGRMKLYRRAECGREML
jgi:hypothetical protein